MLEGELRAARQEAEEAGARHAFELEQARLHAQRCEGEQVRFVLKPQRRPSALPPRPHVLTY